MKLRSGISPVGIILLFALAMGGIAIIMLSNEEPSVLDFAEERNNQRRKDVATIMNAVYSSINDKKDDFLGKITVTDSCSGMPENEICKNEDCDQMVDLSDLRKAGYVEKLPVDPSSEDSRGTGYFIKQDEEGKITVCAPLAESRETVSVTR